MRRSRPDLGCCEQKENLKGRKYFLGPGVEGMLHQGLKWKYKTQDMRI